MDRGEGDIKGAVEAEKDRKGERKEGRMHAPSG